MNDVRIGVIGASGDIGRGIAPALARVLADDPRAATMVLAGRRPDLIPTPATGPLRVERARLDLRARDDLARFAAGLDVVVNAAGPSHDVAEATATAVLESGADYVDVGGPADARTPRVRPVPGRTALFHAGALPGASGILPRWMLRRHPDTRTLTVVTGGRGAFTRAGAEDYLAGIEHGDVEPLAAWRGGERASGAAERRENVVLDEFPDPVALFPYLDADAEEIARTGGVTDGTWYSAMVGDGIVDALMLASGMGIAEGSAWLRDASVAVLAGRRPYVVILVTADGERAMLRAPGEAVLAAEVAAATREVLAGRAPTGASSAAGALDAERMLTALTGPGGSCTLTTGSALEADMMEEGAL